MTTNNLIFCYRGAFGQKDLAFSKLQERFPKATLNWKTSKLVEAQMGLDLETHLFLSEHPEWQVMLPTVAEIRKPTLNLSRIRAKLAESR